MFGGLLWTSCITVRWSLIFCFFSMLTFLDHSKQRGRERKLKSDRALAWEAATANYQMLSICNSAPLFLLARTPGLKDEGWLASQASESYLISKCFPAWARFPCTELKKHGYSTACSEAASGRKMLERKKEKRSSRPNQTVRELGRAWICERASDEGE